MANFDQLYLTPEWQEYWTKYPHGLTIMENLVDWATKVNLMIDYLNLTPDKIEAILREWEAAGDLEQIFERTFINAKDDLNSRSINVLYPPKGMTAAKGDGTMDDTAAIQALINLDKPLYFPKGIYRLTAPLTLHQHNFEGAGPEDTIFKVDGNFHAFLILAEHFNTRNACSVKGFAVYSPNAQTYNKYAFHCPGRPSGASLTPYAFAINFSDLEIGNGDFGYGGGFYFSDAFRMNLQNIGMTGVGNPIYLEGSVVQCTFENITNNADTVPADLGGLPNCGMYLTNKLYASGYHSPESIKGNNLGFVGNHEGIHHAHGLFCRYSNLDLDFIRDKGIYVYSPATFTQVYIASNNQASKFVGVHIDIPDTGNPIPMILRGFHFNAYAALAAGSCAVQYGDGGAEPYREIWGGQIHECWIEGASNGWPKGIVADRTKSLTVQNNYAKEGTVVGKVLDATYCKYALITGNIFPGGEIHVEAPIATAFGRVSENQAIVTSSNITTPTNWVIENNADNI